MFSSGFQCKENDGTTRTVLLHQILPETGQKPGTTQKLNPSHHSGSIPHHQDQRRSAKCAANIKVMLTAFFNSRSVKHHDYAPQGQTIIREYYRDVLRRLHDAVWRKKPELWSTGDWRLNHDNTPAHSSHLIQTFFLAKNQNPVVC